MELGELTTKLHSLYTQQPDALTDKELFKLTVQVEELTAAVQAQAMSFQAAAHHRKAYRARRYRSSATGISNESRLSRATCGRHTNQAHTIVNKLPRIYTAYLAGIFNPDQINLICRYYDISKLQPFAVRDQASFINWALDPWPLFKIQMQAWAEAVDPSDPTDEDEKSFLDRRLVWAQGLDRTVLMELSMPNEMFEVFLNTVGPTYDQLLREEVREARLAAGLNPDEQDDDDRFLDLARTDRQRWLDAHMIVLRAGGSAIKSMHSQAEANGDELDSEDIDPGTGTEVIIILDQKTAEREIARRNGLTLPDLRAEDAKDYRCETLSGMPLSPAVAIDLLELGHFRRMILKPNDLDFSLSKRARYFRGPKRLGLIARDRYCQDPGCGTPADKCEADHIEEWAKGGETVPGNGKMRCGPCHRHKTWLQAHGLWVDPDKPEKVKGSDESNLAGQQDLFDKPVEAA